MKCLLFAAGFLTLTLGSPVLFKACDDHTIPPLSVDVSPCNTQPCHLRHRTNMSLAVKFHSDVDSISATTEVFGLILGLWVPFPLPNSDACLNKNVACPLRSGTDVTYTNVLEVLPAYPEIEVVVKWELKDQNGRELFCFVMPTVITD